MKTYLHLSTKRAIFTSTIAALAFTIFFLHNNTVQGKGAAMPLATNIPLAGAKIVMARMSGTDTLRATSGTNGTFTFPNITTSAGNGASAWTFTVTPTPVTPVKVTVKFNSGAWGLLVHGGTKSSASGVSVYTFMSNSSLTVELINGVVSGTVTKQQ